MKNTYFDLIDQSYNFPQEGFDLRDGYLHFNGIPLNDLIEKYGTPFKLLYLPKIAEQIQKARLLFDKAISNNGYEGSYEYCYCTKCCHFSHVIQAALKEGVNLETSSAFDIDLILKLHDEGSLGKDRIIVHNGYKTTEYLEKIMILNKAGFTNSILVLDSKAELRKLKAISESFEGTLKIGIRMAINEEPQSVYHTSRLGIRPSEILDFYSREIENDSSLSLRMFHFYIDSGIKDNIYYWGEFQKGLEMFVLMKQICPEIMALNLGGGFPIRNNLSDDYDFEYMINQIVENIQTACKDANIEDPNIFTEFGKYTVGESGAIIFQVLEQKQQNESEKWYMVDNSLMNTIPDTWSIFEKFIMLPVNKWDNEYSRVNIGGISCDRSDFYNLDNLNEQLFLPNFSNESSEPLYVGFFHTGAYQDSISGYGGIKHCLIPAPKMIIIDKDAQGHLVDNVYRNEQTVDEMLSILGYNVEN